MDRITEVEDLENFINSPDVVDLIVRYNQNVRNFVNERSYVRLGNILRGNQAIIYVEREYIQSVLYDLGINNINYLPNPMGLLGKISLKVSGIYDVQQKDNLNLKGEGVLIGFVDTGISYTNSSFIHEDGTSKIKFIWDQTGNENRPEGFHFGTQYTNDQINEAISSEDPYSIVRQTDDVGHGTFLASVACGTDRDEYIGAAPEADMIVVKLRKLNSYYMDRFLVPPDQENVYSTADIMLGIEYMVGKANQLRRPLCICLGLGTNQDGHDGFNTLEEYLGTVSGGAGFCICTAVGNESHTGHHTEGKLNSTGDTTEVTVRVPDNAFHFPVYLWNNFTDRFSVSIKSPTGELIGRVPAKAGTILESNLILERSRVSVQYFFPMPGSGSQLTLIKIYDPTPGIWTVILHGDIVLDGHFDAWLPITGMVSPGIEFLTPTPNTTITVPASGLGSVSCGAFNQANNSLYANSSWGPTRLPSIGVDLAAPGVNVTGVYPRNYGTMSGTSVAAAITAGACALMLQWGVVQGNDTSFNTYRIRALLIRGCNRDTNLKYPNYQWGYGKLNLSNTMKQILGE